MKRPLFTNIPTEVFEAVSGNPTPLTVLLRSGDPLSREAREAIALWIEGNLPPDRPAHRPRSYREWGDIPDGVWLQFAAERYHRIARWLGKRGRIYGRSEKLIAAIARKNEVHEGALRNAVRSGPPVTPEPTNDLTELFLVWENARKK